MLIVGLQLLYDLVGLYVINMAKLLINFHGYVAEQCD